MTFRKKVGLAGWLILLVWLAACRGSIEKSQAPATGPPTNPKPAPATAIRSDVGFASRKKLQEHFEKHGREFGASNEGEYLELAQTLRDRPAGGDVLETTRRDGVITRFDRRSGAFLAFNDDRTIRTFFKPNDGENYFHRQGKR